jgi:NAD+ dependent glucose-6-phosphate dehydrogenase
VAKRKILITGMAGRIGRMITQRLSDKYDLTSLDMKPAEGFVSHVANISDLDAIRPAFTGQQTVVHLAADPNADAPWDSIHKNDIVGTYNVMEAAKQAGVERVVFASSNHVVGYLPMKDEPYLAYFEQRDDDLPDPVPMITAEASRPDGFYAVAKAFGESLGSYYWDAFGLSCIALRIGGVHDIDSPEGMGPLGRSLYLSHNDAAHLVDCAISAPASLGFAVVYGVSNNTLRFHDIETAADLIGYHPQDDAGT